MAKMDNGNIRFRAWHKKEKKMCAVDIITFGKGAFLVGVNPETEPQWIGSTHYVVAPTTGRFCSNDEFILMQFTGRGDKKDVDIYDGDVLMTMDQLWKVYFGHPNTETFGEGWCMQPLDSENQYWLDGKIFDECEIIGNIYQNPELMQIDKKVN